MDKKRRGRPRSKPYIHIQANGPFFDIDMQVPEPKAKRILKGLHRVLKAGVDDLEARYRADATRKWRNWVFIPENHGIPKTTIKITKIQ